MEKPEYENFIANKKAAIKFSTGGSQIEFVEHLKRYPNSGRVYISEKDAPQLFAKENSPTFYYYQQGETLSSENLRPVYIKSYGDAFREANNAARFTSDEFGEFTKIDKVNSYFFDDDGVLRSDTPQRRATKERQGNAPKYLDSFNIDIEGSESTTELPIEDIQITEGGKMTDKILNLPLGTTDRKEQKDQEDLLKIQQDEIQKRVSAGGTTESIVPGIDQFKRNQFQNKYSY